MNIQHIKKGQIFTPEGAVRELIEFAGLAEADLYGKRILDCACGSGNILKPLVMQYIKEGHERGIADAEIKRALETNIVGLDIDQECCELCIFRLSEIADKEGIKDVRWRILNVDALKYSFHKEKFDVVIGNPPYVNYHDLDLDTRNYLREHYIVCGKGRFDYYYAFFEFGMKCLSECGELCYLVPNSLYKNVFASQLRKTIKPFLTAIGDFKTRKVFDVLTSSTFVRLEKQTASESIHYYDFDKEDDFFILKDSLLDDAKWTFSISSDEGDSISNQVFGASFHAGCPIATLCNDVFLIRPSFIKELTNAEVLLKNGYRIERGLIRPAISPKSFRHQKEMLIVFPYGENKDGVTRITEKELKRAFPCGYEYLKAHKRMLNARSADNDRQWYEYGRSQGLTNLKEKRLLISTVVTTEVNVIEVDVDTIPYSGIVISALDNQSLAKAKKILKSEEFLEYAHLVGSNISGSSVRITSKDVNRFVYKG